MTNAKYFNSLAIPFFLILKKKNGNLVTAVDINVTLIYIKKIIKRKEAW